MTGLDHLNIRGGRGDARRNQIKAYLKLNGRRRGFIAFGQLEWAIIKMVKIFSVSQLPFAYVNGTYV